MSEKTFHPVAKLDELPAGSRKVVHVEGFEILLCNSNDRIFAVSNICSHADERLDCGRMRAGWIACPVHGARFDLETGEALNPPASVAIATYEVRVSGEQVEVAV